MSESVADLLKVALDLTDAEQLELLSALEAAVEERGLRPFDDSWLETIHRRSESYDRGESTTMSWEQVKAAARADSNA